MYCMAERDSEQQNGDWGSNGRVAALGRAFAILGAFKSDDRHILSLAELARRTGLYKSTILRLLASLEHAGFIRKLQDATYSIGPEPLRLARIYQDSFQVKDVIYPLLQKLSKDSGETASYYVRQHNSRVVLYRVEPTRNVRFSLREGEQFPLDLGASGKVLIAFSQPRKKRFAEVRERLWAVSYGERDPETASASAPVFGMGQELKGALTLSGPRERFTPENLRTGCRLLLAAAAQATATLGGDPTVFSHAVEHLV
jgi:DNA-binding IclR family transcriptional regulator